MTAPTREFRNLPIHFADLDHARIAYRRIGAGRPLVLVHGWPFNSLTWRFLLPLLSPHFSCIAPDLPGTGQTIWTERTPFRFAEQAKTLSAFVDSFGFESVDMLAHDTGATMARLAALLPGSRLRRLVLLNTEIPRHRPPWIPLYSRLLKIPKAVHALVPLLRTPSFVASRAGFGGCFWDAARIDADLIDCYVRPILASGHAREGYGRYLAGFDWRLVDDFAAAHHQITLPVRLVWGEDDPTFPAPLASAMAAGFGNSHGIRMIPRARLLVHEERPDEVAGEVLRFLA